MLPECNEKFTSKRGSCWAEALFSGCCFVTMDGFGGEIGRTAGLCQSVSMHFGNGIAGHINESVYGRTCAAPMIGEAAMKEPMRAISFINWRTTNNVTLDVEGSGILLFCALQSLARKPVALCRRWERADCSGNEHSRSKTIPPKIQFFCRAKLFRLRWAVTWAATKGADLSWVPHSIRSVRSEWAIREHITALDITFISNTRAAQSCLNRFAPGISRRRLEMMCSN